MLNSRKWENDVHKVHFESGVRTGIGAFNLVRTVLVILQSHLRNNELTAFSHLSDDLAIAGKDYQAAGVHWILRR